jgi:hypothetical protein
LRRHSLVRRHVDHLVALRSLAHQSQRFRRHGLPQTAIRALPRGESQDDRIALPLVRNDHYLLRQRRAILRNALEKAPDPEGHVRRTEHELVVAILRGLHRKAKLRDGLHSGKGKRRTHDLTE